MIARLNGRPARCRASRPPRPFERGVRRRPTLVQNVETLAHLALIARHGADWFRAARHAEQPGTALVTLGGAVERPGVYEIALGRAARATCSTGPAASSTGARGARAAATAAAWVAPRSSAAHADDGDCAARSELVGAGVLWCSARPVRSLGVGSRPVLAGRRRAPASAGRASTASRAIADAFERLAHGRAHPGDRARLARWGAEVTGRGACRHPDGAARFLESALRVFADELDDHGAGRCEPRRAPSMPVPLAQRRRRETQRLAVDPIACDGHGAVRGAASPSASGSTTGATRSSTDEPVPAELLAHARRAVAACPTLALRLAGARGGGVSVRIATRAGPDASAARTSNERADQPHRAQS